MLKNPLSFVLEPSDGDGVAAFGITVMFVAIWALSGSVVAAILVTVFLGWALAYPVALLLFAAALVLEGAVALVNRLLRSRSPA